MKTNEQSDRNLQWRTQYDEKLTAMKIMKMNACVGAEAKTSINVGQTIFKSLSYKECKDCHSSSELSECHEDTKDGFSSIFIKTLPPYLNALHPPLHPTRQNLPTH